jgi:hypothetical protein
MKKKKKNTKVNLKPQESLISVLGRETRLASRHVYFIPKERDYCSSGSAFKKTDDV